MKRGFKFLITFLFLISFLVLCPKLLFNAPELSPADSLPYEGAVEGIPEVDIPVFPWPTPTRTITLSDLVDFSIQPGMAHTLSEVNILLRSALLRCEYEYQYYAVTNGFALVTKLEQFDLEGYTLEEKRWELEPSYNGFDLANIFRPPEGYYRIIVFAVTDEKNPDSVYVVSRDEADAWLKDGCLALPEAIGEREFSSNHYCVALIYEFEQIGKDEHPQPTTTSVSAWAHINNSGLLDKLLSM